MYREHMDTMNISWRDEALGHLQRVPKGGEYWVDSTGQEWFQLPSQSEPYRLFFRSATKNSVNSLRYSSDRYLADEALLVFPYVSRTFQAWLYENELQFVDASGNMWIERGGTYIWVEGRKKIDMVLTRKSPKIFRATGLKILFVLLAFPELLGSTVRSIASASGASVGAVSNTLKELEAEGYLEVDGRERFLHRRSQLIEQWCEHYRLELLPALKERRVDGLVPAEWRAEISRYRGAYLLSGENALAVSGMGISPETTTIYGDFPWKQLVVDHRLRPSSTGTTFLREQFWQVPSESWEGVSVPGLLVYADALASGNDRQIEIAEKYWAQRGEL